MLRNIAILALCFGTLEAMALDQPYTIVLTSGAGGAVVETSNLKTSPTPTPITGGSPYLAFNCRTGVDCTKLKVKLGEADLSPDGTPTKTSARYPVPVGKLTHDTTATLTIEIEDGGATKPIITAELIRELQEGDGATNAATGSTSIDEMLKNPCLRYLEQNPPEGSYDEKNNRAVIYVAADGTFLTDPPENIDDNDTIELHIIADEEIGQIRAMRTSPVATRELRVVGEQQRSSITLQSLQERPCREQIAFVSDFAAPRAEIQLRSGKTVLAKLDDIPINQRYWGMYSLGPAQTKLVDQSFKVVKKGDQNVIGQEVVGDDDLRYTLFVTAFITGKRDIEKPIPYLSLQRINPTVGVTVQRAADNFMFGLSYEVRGVVFTAGQHWSRMTMLDPASGLSVGSPFTGTATEIPTVKNRDSDTFYAVSLDLRVAVELFTSVVRGGS